MHHSCEPVNILSDLKSRGLNIALTPKLKHKNKQTLIMFMLLFQHHDSVEKIHGIREIMGFYV